MCRIGMMKFALSCVTRHNRIKKRRKIMSAIRNNDEILFEAKFVLPETTPSGFVKEEVHEELEGVLVETFGGFTANMVEAYKMDEVIGKLAHDDAVSYEVIIPNSALAIDKLKALAIKYAAQLEQDFVLFKQPNGEVYYLDVK